MSVSSPKADTSSEILDPVYGHPSREPIVCHASEERLSMMMNDIASFEKSRVTFIVIYVKASLPSHKDI